jgi:hypothetical protein
MAISDCVTLRALRDGADLKGIAFISSQVVLTCRVSSLDELAAIGIIRIYRLVGMRTLRAPKVRCATQCSGPVSKASRGSRSTRTCSRSATTGTGRAAASAGERMGLEQRSSGMASAENPRARRGSACRQPCAVPSESAASLASADGRIGEIVIDQERQAGHDGTGVAPTSL